MFTFRRALLPATSAASAIASLALLKTGSKTFCSDVQSPIANKVVLITGASAGIGEACAITLAKHNVKLILVGRRIDKLEQLKAAIQKQYPGVEIHVEALSVTDMPTVASLPNRLPKEFASVDIIINNAGLALGVTSVENNNVQDAENVIMTNVMGTIAMCSAFLPGMKSRGCGHLVNMGSVAGHYAYATGSGDAPNMCIFL
jgi:NADP-dependent 3-hydroxy acid dehydrogenase YdfG